MAFHIGDFIWATSAIAVLKKTYPNIHITVMASKTLKELIIGNPAIDNVLFSSYPKDGTSLIFSVKNFLANLIHIPKILLSRYDDLIILNRSIITIWLSKLCFIPNIVGGDLKVGSNDTIDPISKYYTHKIYVPRGGQNAHASLRFHAIIKSYFGIYNNALPVLPNAAGYDKVANEFIKPSDKKLHISICTRGAGDFLGHRWGVSNFIYAIKELSAKINVNFYILGGMRNNSEAEEIINGTGGNVYNLCGKTSLLECFNFLKKSDLLISVDTGVPHLCAIAKTPYVTLYATVPPQSCMPLGGVCSKSKTISYGARNCFSCDLSDVLYCEDRSNAKCMDLIKPQVVIDSALEILKGKI
jgi:heptosyltransferase-2